jgi:sulfur carrier protein ThiS adenylyltransferase
MNITVNERPSSVAAGTTLRSIHQAHRPDADIVILNGGVMVDDCVLKDGDAVVLIRRGAQPSRDEFEALMAARHTPGVHQRLKRACVGIAGLGGLGSMNAIALARIGVGRLILVDFDVVEPSNLNRQQYFTDQIGMGKAEAIAATLMRINPFIACQPVCVKLEPSNIADVFKDADVLIEAFDRPDMKAMLAASYKNAYPDRPIVMASGVAGCGPENSIRVHEPGTGLFVVGDLETAAEPGTGLMAPRVGIAAHMQANLAVRLILEKYT